MTTEIPGWLGKTSVPETRDTTLELLRTWSSFVGEQLQAVNTDWSVSDKDFVAKACEIANRLIAKQDIPRSDTAIWVGFPDTPIGRLNAKLAGVVWAFHFTRERGERGA